MSRLESFRLSIRMLNSHFWLLMTLSEHVSGQFAAMPALAGLKHELVIPSVFHFAPTYAKKIRTSNKTLPTDMAALAKAAEAWLPAYFIILAKSIAESVIKDMLEDLYADNADAKASIDAMVNVKVFRKRDKDKISEWLAQAITNGSFKEVKPIIDIAAKLGSAATTSAVVKKYRKIRNAMAHDLGEQYKNNVQVTANDFENYVSALQKVVCAVSV